MMNIFNSINALTTVKIQLLKTMSAAEVDNG